MSCLEEFENKLCKNMEWFATIIVWSCSASVTIIVWNCSASVTELVHFLKIMLLESFDNAIVSFVVRGRASI
jgi:hypothetical protein